jgi:hypothetical protein
MKILTDCNFFIIKDALEHKIIYSSLFKAI